MRTTLAAALLVIVSITSPQASFGQGAAATERSSAVASPLQKERDNSGEYSVSKKGLALDGFDPVAYFKEFGGKAKKGDKKITTKHEGVVYRFSSEANRKAFLAEPSRFQPMYGGWCAWAMADGKGSKTEPDAESFTIEDGRLYVFYDGFFADTRKSWKKKGGAPKLKSTADNNWTRISGEAARAGDTPKPAPKPVPKPVDKGKGKGKN
ncbi:MAG: YHS domain-containing protein [Planctomycetota bacterium]|jgi:YHS domain-containing protein